MEYINNLRCLSYVNYLRCLSYVKYQLSQKDLILSLSKSIIITFIKSLPCCISAQPNITLVGLDTKMSLQTTPPKPTYRNSMSAIFQL